MRIFERRRNGFIGLLSVGLPIFAFVALTPTAARAGAGGTTLGSGETLTAGQNLYSPGNPVQGGPGGQYELDMQSDGNLVLYVGTSRRPLWALSYETTPQAGSYVTVQPSDGNLVVYNSSHSPVWSVENDGVTPQVGDYLTVQADSNLVLYNPSGTTPLWTDWSHHGFQNTTIHTGEYLKQGWFVLSVNSSGQQYELLMQSDGNMVLINVLGLYTGTGHGQTTQAVWSTGTSQGSRTPDPHPPGSSTYAVMQSDGNFVLYNSVAGAVWALSYQGVTPQSNSTVNITADPWIAVKNSAGTQLWSSPVGTIPCNPGRTGSLGSPSAHVGEQDRAGSALGGVYAQVLNMHPYIAPGADTSSGWVALQSGEVSDSRCPNGSGSNCFAQIGWYEKPDGSEVVFTEACGGTITSCPTQYHQEFAFSGVGTRTFYSVQTTQNGVFTFWINGSYAAQVNSGLQLDAADLATEVHTLNDSEMAGGMRNYEDFESANVYSAGAWQGFGIGTAIQEKPYYGIAIDSAVSAKTWDASCAV